MARTSKRTKQDPKSSHPGQRVAKASSVESGASPPSSHPVLTDQPDGADGAPGQGEPDELVDGLAHLRELLEQDDLEAARRLVRELESRWPHSDRVRHQARTLAPPTVRLRPDIPNVSRHREHAWLRQHAHEYPGCWIAVLGDQLVAADRDLKVVVSRMKEDRKLKDAILYFAGRDPE